MLKALSRRIAVRVFFSMVAACVAVDAFAFWLLANLSRRVALLEQHHAAFARIAGLAKEVNAVEHLFWIYFVPASVVFFALLALILWLSLRRTARGHMRTPAEHLPAQPKKVEPFESKPDAAMQQRTYVHLISVLQRKGRLLDFLSEDLTQFGDAQIGAAVRNIHENCKKAVEKHLAPKAVLGQSEGEQITVEADFDPNTVKLVGQVTGGPPFSGIVRHRGWRAAKIEIPTFTGRQPPDVLAPAEIEVQG